MRIIVTGGGTGGHIFPALEIAKEFKRHQHAPEVIFIGNKNSLEERMATVAHLRFFGLRTKKLVGQNWLQKIGALFFLGVSFLQALVILIRLRPKAVIGVGGYVSAPVILASFVLGIKRYICEQNVVPGFANKYLAYLAKRIFISFENSRSYFPRHKVVFSGNPVRHEFFALPEKNLSSFRILVTGGSLGASFINHEIPTVLASVIKECPDLKVTHQTGQPMLDEVRAHYHDLGITAHVVPFIDNMPRAFSDHDVLVSRAGATVCAEIMASGMPAILIPYPFANGHQKYNAEALAKIGAAVMVEQNDRFQPCLASTLKTFYSDRMTLLEMTKRSKSLGAAGAAATIVHHVFNDL